MANEVGFIHCLTCNSVQTVLECGGQKKGTFYTSCECGKTQGGGLARQQLIKKNMVLTMDEYKKNSEQNTLNTENNTSGIHDICSIQQESIIDNKISKLRMDVEIEEPFEKPFSKGFLAMCCGLAAGAGVLIGIKIGGARA